MQEVLPKHFKNKLELSLLSLRLGVFIVMLVWTIDKLTNPTHSANVMKAFYGLEGLSTNIFYILGILQLILVTMFLVGFKKRFSYGVVLVLHTISTLASFPKYIDFNSLTLFAAWPMLGACITLYVLREYDKKFALK